MERKLMVTFIGLALVLVMIAMSGGCSLASMA